MSDVKKVISFLIEPDISFIYVTIVPNKKQKHVKRAND